MKKIDRIADNLRSKYDFTYSQVFEIMEKNGELRVPISIFSERKLGALEAVVRYLHDKEKLKFVRIAQMLNRNQKTIWVSYNNAKNKLK